MTTNQVPAVKAASAMKDADAVPKSEYHVVGFISSGTYGKVYKAEGQNHRRGQVFAIKKYTLSSLRSLSYWCLQRFHVLLITK